MESNDTKKEKVHIEFQRVQTWLFAVPRLRAMVGANTLLGEVLRVELPKLAQEPQNEWQLAPLSGCYSSACSDDPLIEHDNPSLCDDPSKDAMLGILSKDGGHFEAYFEKGSESFAKAASELIHNKLPRLRFKVSINDQEVYPKQTHLSTELPILAPCEWSGRGIASAFVSQGSEQDEGHEKPAVSSGVALQHEASKRAEKWEAKDIATLISAKTKLQCIPRAYELGKLVGNGYLALIHADGNSVGSSAKGKEIPDRSAFFHRNRVLIRKALKVAIDKICALDEPRRKKNDSESYAPIIPLMVGGDDLLLVCRAESALPFVIELCRELDTLQENQQGFKLTLGIGVVIAQHKIPLHRLHEVVEQLAGSAKRRFRGFQELEKKQSVVDWAVYTTSWIDDPEEIRRRDWIRCSGNKRRVLSQRPINVLGNGLDSLEGLIKGAENLKKAPRSQLRYLVEQLSHGECLAELAFTELSPQASNALRAAGICDPWQSIGNDRVTPLLDLVEIAEATNLGCLPENNQGGATNNTKEITNG